MGFDGVLADVVAEVVQLRLAADDVVKAFVLPERAFAIEPFVDGASGKTFDGMQAFGERPVGFRCDEGVNVVGHDDGFVQVQASAVPMLQGVHNDLSLFGLAEDAGAVTGVEQLVPAGVEGFGVLPAKVIR